jgi:hypothetical protein
MKLALQALNEVAALMPGPGGLVLAGIGKALSIALDSFDAWADVEMRRQILEAEARVDAEAAIAFPGVRKTEPPAAPDTEPGRNPFEL